MINKPTRALICKWHPTRDSPHFKGHINNNIDWDWTGGRLLYPTKIEDHRTKNNGVVPAPSSSASGRRDLGLSFDKKTPDKPYDNCDTIGGDYANPWLPLAWLWSSKSHLRRFPQHSDDSGHLRAFVCVFHVLHITNINEAPIEEIFLNDMYALWCKIFTKCLQQMVWQN